MGGTENLMKRYVLIAVICIFTTSLAWAKYQLTEKDIQRVKVLRQSIAEVEKKSWQKMVADIEKMDYPAIQLEIQDAMAKAYVDVVQEQNVQGQKKKEWLYSMVALNMAYLQFAGAKDSAGGSQNLNKLIRYKLKSYLPQGIYNKPGFHCSIE